MCQSWLIAITTPPITTTPTITARMRPLVAPVRVLSPFPQQALNFFPLPQGQASLRDTFMVRTSCAWPSGPPALKNTRMPPGVQVEFIGGRRNGCHIGLNAWVRQGAGE